MAVRQLSLFGKRALTSNQIFERSIANQPSELGISRLGLHRVFKRVSSEHFIHVAYKLFWLCHFSWDIKNNVGFFDSFVFLFHSALVFLFPFLVSSSGVIIFRIEKCSASEVTHIHDPLHFCFSYLYDNPFWIFFKNSFANQCIFSY